MGVEFDKRLSIRDAVWVAGVFFALVFGGFQLSSAVRTNTEGAKEGIKVMQGLDGRVSKNEAWILRKEGYDSRVAEEAREGRDAGQN